MTADSSKTTWRLVAPDWAALDTIWRNPRPFILWHVGNQTLLAHWMDEAVRRGVREVEIYAADRPAEVRAWLEDGAYWSRPVKVIPLSREADAPADAERMTSLPCEPASSADPATPTRLLEHWLGLQNLWLHRRTHDQAQLDAVHETGGWIGPRASIDPTAQLIAPFWIGAGAKIGAQCVIGPNAFVSRDSVIDEDVEIQDAFVSKNSYVGKHTRIAHGIACGNVLVDMLRGQRIEIGERFILAPLADKSSRPSLGERLAALACYVLLAPAVSACNRAGWIEQRISTCDGVPITLRTGRGGPLWARRWPWLRHVVAGRMRWIGALPREDHHWQKMPIELSERVRLSRAGLFSLADVHDCHTPADPEEWIHASYQAHYVDPNVTRTVIKNIWKIAWSRQSAPLSSA